MIDIDTSSVCSTCSRHCCWHARPPITPTRRRMIERYLQDSCWTIVDPFLRTTYTFPRERNDGTCVFLHPTRLTCRIHSVKPETCVAGPVTFDVDRSVARIRWYLKTRATCPLSNTLIADVAQLNRHVALAKQFIVNLLRDLDGQEVSAILAIEEPDTDWIGNSPLPPELWAKLRITN
jgi:Fe-S-cluster containining protein